MSDAYKFWRECLAAKQAAQPLPTATVDDPQCGFWRMRRGTGKIPVAVFLLDGRLAFKIGREVVGADMGTELWSHYCAHPISEEEYRKVAEQGGDWSDSDPTVTAMTSGKIGIVGTAPRGPVHLPGVVSSRDPLVDAIDGISRADVAAAHAVPAKPDPVTEFREETASALAGVAAYARIETDEAQTRAASLRNMLLKIKKDADDARTAEKAPHLKAAKAVDEKWRQVIADADAGAAKLRRAMEVFEDDKRAAAAKATQLQREAEERHAREAAAAAAANKPAPPPPPPVQSNMPPPAATQVRPTYGKAASVGTQLQLTDLDVDKFLVAVRQKPQWAAIVQNCREVAEVMARNGIVVDGMETAERTKIR